MLNIKMEKVKNAADILPKTYLGVVWNPDVIAISKASIDIGMILENP